MWDMQEGYGGARPDVDMLEGSKGHSLAGPVLAGSVFPQLWRHPVVCVGRLLGQARRLRLGFVGHSASLEDKNWVYHGIKRAIS